MTSGEGFGTDMRRAYARHANKVLRGEKSENTYLDLGEEHGEVQTSHIRFREALEEGHLRAYIRQEATDPKVITTVIALGVVAAGIYTLKHRKKQKP